MLGAELGGVDREDGAVEPALEPAQHPRPLDLVEHTDAATSKESWTRESVVFTPWPPGPDARE